MITDLEFTPFPKIARLNREIVVTEKIDGTNASICVLADGTVRAASRSRWITPEADNHGFAKWAKDHEEELRGLGEGLHFGEWWGSGIQRGYNLPKGEKRFSLFNVARWDDSDPAKTCVLPRPKCCGVVPTLYRGPFDQKAIHAALDALRSGGSAAAPGFMRPEGVVVFHSASSTLYKVTIEGDEKPKGQP